MYHKIWLGRGSMRIPFNVQVTQAEVNVQIPINLEEEPTLTQAFLALAEFAAGLKELGFTFREQERKHAGRKKVDVLHIPLQQSS